MPSLTKQVYSHQIASGSNDDTIRVWDMRSLKSIYTIPAHKSAISDLKFFHAAPVSPSAYPLTTLPRGFSSLDVFASTKAEEDKSHDAEPNGDEEKPDVPLSGSFLISGGYDGVVKIWSADDWQQIKSMTSDASGKVMSVDVSAGEHCPTIVDELDLTRFHLQTPASSPVQNTVGPSSFGRRRTSISSRRDQVKSEIEPFATLSSSECEQKRASNSEPACDVR